MWGKSKHRLSYRYILFPGRSKVNIKIFHIFILSKHLL